MPPVALSDGEPRRDHGYFLVRAILGSAESSAAYSHRLRLTLAAADRGRSLCFRGHVLDASLRGRWSGAWPGHQHQAPDLSRAGENRLLANRRSRLVLLPRVPSLDVGDERLQPRFIAASTCRLRHRGFERAIRASAEACEDHGPDSARSELDCDRADRRACLPGADRLSEPCRL